MSDKELILLGLESVIEKLMERLLDNKGILNGFSKYSLEDLKLYITQYLEIMQKE